VQNPLTPPSPAAITRESRADDGAGSTFAPETKLSNSPYAAMPVTRDCEASRVSGISWGRATPRSVSRYCVSTS